MANQMFDFSSVFETPDILRKKREAQLAQSFGGALTGPRGAMIRAADTFGRLIGGDPEMERAREAERIMTETGNAFNDDVARGSDMEEAQIRAMVSAAARLAASGNIPDSTKLRQMATQMQISREERVLEQRKLSAEIVNAENKPVLDAAAEARAEEDQEREAMLFPDQAAKAASDRQLAEMNVVEAANAGVNMLNPKTGEIKNVTKLDSLARKALRDAGWIEVGLSVQGQNTGDLGITKQTQKTLEGNLMASRAQLQSMANIGRKYDPKFTQLPTQLLMAGANAYERFGGTLTPAIRGTAQQYHEFRSNVFDTINNYIKFITGAQMSRQEAERIMKVMPNPDTDGATKFESSAKAVVRQVLQVQKRAAEALRHGLILPSDPDAIDALWNATVLPPVSDAEVEAFMSQQFGWGKPVIATQDSISSDDDLINSYYPQKP